MLTNQKYTRVQTSKLCSLNHLSLHKFFAFKDFQPFLSCKSRGHSIPLQFPRALSNHRRVRTHSSSGKPSASVKLTRTKVRVVPAWPLSSCEKRPNFLIFKMELTMPDLMMLRRLTNNRKHQDRNNGMGEPHLLYSRHSHPGQGWELRFI